MDTVVLVVGSLAAIVCGWFALQILFKLLLGAVKLGALAVLAYFAAQITWINAEIPEVASSDVAKLIKFVESRLETVSLPSIKVELNYDESQPPSTVDTKVSPASYPLDLVKSSKKDFF